jgi:hypothetical protein
MQRQTASSSDRIGWSADRLGKRLAAFIGDSAGKPARVSNLVRYPAGLSWVTFGFTAEIGRGTARADPAGGRSPRSSLVVPGAARVPGLDAPAGVPGLPIPKANWYSDDPSILGAPFIVSERVPGDTPRLGAGRRTAAKTMPSRARTSSVQGRLSGKVVRDFWALRRISEVAVAAQVGKEESGRNGG